MKLRWGLGALVLSTMVMVLSACDLSSWLIVSGVSNNQGNLVTAVVLPDSQITPFAPTLIPSPSACVPQSDLPAYVVVFGDTLSTIAVRAGTSVLALLQMNCLSDPNTITVGQILHVPVVIPTLVPAISFSTPTNTMVSGSILTDRPGRFDTPTPDPVINSFSVTPLSAAGGDSVTITWTVSGVQSVTIRSILADGNTAATYANQPLSGTLTDVIPSSARDWITYQLLPDPLPPRGAFAEVTVQLQPSVQRPEIVAYSPDAYTAFTGETITLFWDVRGANGVSIRVVLPSGQFGPWYNDLPAQGNLSYSFPDGITGHYAFQLVPLPEDPANAIGQVAVDVAAPQ